MKTSMLTTLVAVPLLSLSSMAFSAEPVQLTTAQMDSVTAGTYVRETNYARVFQFNASPVTVTQVSVLNIGRGDNGNNTAIVNSGNFSSIRQRN